MERVCSLAVWPTSRFSLSSVWTLKSSTCGNGLKREQERGLDPRKDLIHIQVKANRPTPPPVRPATTPPIRRAGSIPVRLSQKTAPADPPGPKLAPQRIPQRAARREACASRSSLAANPTCARPSMRRHRRGVPLALLRCRAVGAARGSRSAHPSPLAAQSRRARTEPERSRR